MRNQKALILAQLDRKIAPLKSLERLQVPENGWIYAIRRALQMTLTQLGDRLSMTRQGAKKLEEREAAGSISLKTLREVARVLDMKLIYGFIPNADSLDEMVTAKADSLARKIVMRTHQNMQLEDQGNTKEQILAAIAELSSEIKKEMRRSLWD